mgnify:FL=1
MQAAVKSFLVARKTTSKVIMTWSSSSSSSRVSHWCELDSLSLSMPTTELQIYFN